MNSGLKVITKNINKNTPAIHDFQFSKQNSVYVLFFFQKGKGTIVKTLEVYNVKTLEVYNVKILEVYNVKTLEVYNVKTPEVYNVKTLEVSYYQILTGGNILIIPNIELM